MSFDNMTLMLSLDNCVYGVLTNALDCHPFNIITRMKFDYTYLYGIKTMKVFAMSKDIEEIISQTSNGASFKPFFVKHNQSTKSITTKYDENQTQSVYIDVFKIINDTNNILSGNLDNDFVSFCNEFINEFEIAKYNDEIFENLQDFDMMVQCNNLLQENSNEFQMLV